MTGGDPNAGHERPRRSLGKSGRTLLRSCAYTLAGLLLLGAAGLGGLRLLLPEIGRYRPEIEQWMHRLLERRVEIGTIDASWRGWTPVFRIGDVRLVGDETAQGRETRAHPPIRFADLTFSVDLLESIRSGTLQARGITVSGASFVVVRQSDGAFSIQGIEPRSAGEPRPDVWFAQWLLSRKNLSLHSARILWIDEKRRSSPLPLTRVALRLEQETDRHRVVSGSFELPGDGRVEFTMDLMGNPLTPSWSGSTSVTATHVDLDPFGLDARRLGAERFSGRLSGTVWSTWKNARLAEAEGKFRIESPGITDGAQRRGLDEVSASFNAERTSHGWTFAMRDLAVTTRNGSWPRSGARVHWTAPRDGQDGAFVVHVDFARIEDLAALVPSGADPPTGSMLNALLEAAAPRGELRQLHVSVPIAERVDFERASAQGRFAHVRFGSEAWLVSIDAASGQFEASPRRFTMDVVAGSLRVNAPRWLAHPLRGKNLRGAFTAVPEPAGTRLRFEEASFTTPLGTVAAHGWVFSPRDGSGPEIDVALDLGASKITAARDLLAESTLPVPVARWIEASLDGDIRGASLRFHGRRPAPSPGAGGDAGGAGGVRFEATVALALPVCRYAPDWPELSDVSGTVRFDGSRLDAHVESGRIFQSKIREGRVVVEDVRAAGPVAEISGSVEGPSSDAIRFLAESPLRKKHAGVLDSLTLQGGSTVDFRVMLPLRDPRRTTIEGTLALDGNRVGVSGVDRGFEAVSGVVAFRDGGIESEGVTATWLGEPIRAVLGASPERANATRLTVDGRGTRRQLAAYLHGTGAGQASPDGSTLLARVRGDFPWSATVDFPHAGDGAADGRKWRFAADLTEVSLDLPPPFGKTGGTERVLGIESRVETGSEQVIGVRYGDLASAVFRVAPDAERLRLERGAVRFGAGETTLPDAPGVIVHGVLPALDAGAWSALFEDIVAFGVSDAGTPALDHLHEVSIDTGSFVALSTRFPGTRIRMARTADGGWRIGIADSHDKGGEPRLEGKIDVPHDLAAAPVVADFRRLVLEPESSEPRGERRAPDPRTPDPRTFPAISFSARDLVFDGIDLGHVVLRTEPSEHGMRIERLAIRADSFEGDGAGDWSFVDARHRTEFGMQVRGDDLGRMLGSLGTDGSVIAGGATEVSMRGSWEGTPADFALDRVAGILQFHSAGGRLNRLEPGVTGRLFGLLTVTSLPRRIILDFGDLFRGGFEYDRIEGTFAIEQGHAYTDNFLLESDTARFEVVGRTGLVDEDYDKIVTVIPKISSTLPFLPLWLVQKILRRDVFDENFAYEYKITGTWDAPEIELIKIPVPEDGGRVRD